MENIVVTIARQYGSGGKTVGEMYAKELGIPILTEEEFLDMIKQE